MCTDEQLINSSLLSVSSIDSIFIGSPAPLNAKRKRCTPFDDADNDENSEQTDEVYLDMGVDHEELFNDSFHDLANE